MSIKTKIYRAKIIASVECSALIETLEKVGEVERKLMEEFHRSMTDKGIQVTSSGATLTEMASAEELESIKAQLAAARGI